MKQTLTKGFEKEHSDNIVELSLKYLYRTLWPCLFEGKEVTRDRTTCLERRTSGNSDWRTQTDKRGKKGGSGIVGNCVTRTYIYTHKYTHMRTVCTHTQHMRTHTHAHNHYFRHQRLSTIMCYGVWGRYGRMAFLIKTIRSLIALGFHLILRH